MTNAILLRRRQYAGTSSVDVRFGELTDRTPGSAHQRLKGNDRLDRDNLALLTVLKERGDRAAMDAHMRPQLAIYNDVDPEPLTDELLIEDSKASAQEQVERSEFQARKTDSELADLRKSSLHDAMVSYRVYDACVAEERLRREGKK